MGVHRFTFDGRYAYISPEIEGYVGNIVMILDLVDPARPAEVGRWWMPGQRTAGGETPTWQPQLRRLAGEAEWIDRVQRNASPAARRDFLDFCDETDTTLGLRSFLALAS
jgi:hypothetical protein